MNLKITVYDQRALDSIRQDKRYQVLTKIELKLGDNFIKTRGHYHEKALRHLFKQINIRVANAPD